MHRLSAPLVSLVVTLLAAQAADAALLRHGAPPTRTAPLRIAHGHASEVVVLAAPGALAVDAQHGLRARDARLTAALARFGIDRADPHAGDAARGVFVLTSHAPAFDPWAAAAALQATGTVRAAAPNLALHLCETVPDDTFLVDQWWVPTAATGGIHLPQAWDVERGSATVRIGIIDTGVDTGHPDLASQIWTNPGEIPGNGVDDDGDGFVDDVHGWDFGNGDADPNPEPMFDPDYNIDVAFHGTFVAALAGAATNNFEGIAGSAWNCRIVPLKVADSTGDITVAATGAAMAYATAKHLEVINLSLGAADSGGVLANFFQPLVNDANAAGMVCVAAAGNDGVDGPFYPARAAGVIAVGSTNNNDERSSFSNWGTWVTVGAPGELMWSAINRNYVIDDYSLLFYWFFFGQEGDYPYMEGDGTSFASPVVAGICGLVRSRFPGLTPGQVRHQIVATGDVVAYDEPIGPRINAYRAVTLPPAGVAPGGAEVTLALAVSPNPMRSACTLRWSMAQPGAVTLALYDLTGRRVRLLASGMADAGRHEVRWDGNGTNGRPAAPGVYHAVLQRGGATVSQRLVRIE
jgi:subtilisin family serine protease